MKRLIIVTFVILAVLTWIKPDWWLTVVINCWPYVG